MTTRTLQMRRRLIILLTCFSAYSITACDVVEPDAFEPEVVVESYQIAGERLQPVRLSWSVSIDQAYDPEAHAIRGAEVFIELLNEDGVPEAEYPFEEAQAAAGLYVSSPQYEAQPMRRYRLRVRVPEIDHEIHAETVVPDTFSVVDQTADTLVYQQDRAQFSLTESRHPERQSIYIFSTTAQDVQEDNLTPFYLSLYNASEENVTLNDLRITSSGALNEANFSADDDGHVQIDFPWVAVAFYGQNQVSIAAIDDSYYDFVRSQQAQQGGFGFSPGEIPNVISNVAGGTGLFGSFAGQTVELYVRR